MSGDHVDMVHPEIMQTMRDHAKSAGQDVKSRAELDAVDRMTDAEVLDAFDRDYPGGAAGYVQDIGASV